MADPKRQFGKIGNLKTLRTKKEILREVALNPSDATAFVEHHRHFYDIDGNLFKSELDELRYAAQPVAHVIDMLHAQDIEYDGPERAKIDELFLQGFWTPTGLIQKAKLVFPSSSGKFPH